MLADTHPCARNRAHMRGTARNRHEYELDDDAARGRLVLVTNWAPDGQAEDFLVAQAPVPTKHADRSSWQVIRPHVPGCLVLDAVPFSGHMVYLLRENALPRILVETQATGETAAIEFDEEAYDLALGAMGEYDTARLRYLRLHDHADANH